MIEIILIFTAGFLSATLLALFAVPALWRRSRALTERRLHASLPSTLAEARAERDLVRADYAMRLRKLELSMAKAQEKAALGEAALGRIREENRQLLAMREGQGESLQDLEEENAEQATLLAENEKTIETLRRENHKLADRVAKAERKNETLSRSLDERQSQRDDLQGRLKHADRAGKERFGEIDGLKKTIAEQARTIEMLRADGGAVSADGSSDRGEDALLAALDRFAEQTVAAAARREGPDGPIHTVLGDQDGEASSLGSRLASRIAADENGRAASPPTASSS